MLRRKRLQCTANGRGDVIVSRSNIIVLTITSPPQVDIDLGAEHGADTVRVNTSMAFIGTDGNRFHFRDDNAAHYSIHLYRVISRIPSNYSFYNSALLFTPIQNGVSNVAPEIHLFLPWLS